MSYRLVPTRGDGQSTFAGYVPERHVNIAPANGLLVLTITDSLSARSPDSTPACCPGFGLPRTLSG